MMLYLRVLLVTLLLSSGPVSSALVKLDITSGSVEPISLAIASNNSKILGSIVSDLNLSGMFAVLDDSSFPERITEGLNFDLWKKISLSLLVKLHVSDADASVKIWDPYSAKKIYDGKLSAGNDVELAHKVSNVIYKIATGDEGYFHTKIAYVRESGNLRRRVKKLVVMDNDGKNEQELTNGRYLVMTPRFSPDGRYVLYVSYEYEVPKVFLYDMKRKNKRLLCNFAGMSFTPRFSPDGKKILISVAKDGATNLYQIDLSSMKMKKMTHSLKRINTSPDFSPDGKQIVFNADHKGAPEIYVMDSDGGNIKQISNGEGRYTAPVWSPRGDYIAFTKSIKGTFYIGVMRPDGSAERLLTSGWMVEGPAWAPNGRIIGFSKQAPNGGNKLYAIDVTGYYERRLPIPSDAADVTWSF